MICVGLIATPIKSLLDHVVKCHAYRENEFSLISNYPIYCISDCAKLIYLIKYYYYIQSRCLCRTSMKLCILRSIWILLFVWNLRHFKDFEQLATSWITLRRTLLRFEMKWMNHKCHSCNCRLISCSFYLSKNQF